MILPQNRREIGSFRHARQKSAGWKFFIGLWLCRHRSYRNMRLRQRSRADALDGIVTLSVKLRPDPEPEGKQRGERPILPARAAKLLLRAPKAAPTAGGVASPFSALLALLTPKALESAAANGDTRTLYLYHAHRKDSIAATFRVNGHYDRGGAETAELVPARLAQRRGNQHGPAAVRRAVGGLSLRRPHGGRTIRSPCSPPIAARRPTPCCADARIASPNIRSTCSARRWTPPSPACRWRSCARSACACSAAASAIIPGLNFVHLDVGGVRHWPRMNYDQLARLFPDGKTVLHRLQRQDPARL